MLQKTQLLSQLPLHTIIQKKKKKLTAIVWEKETHALFTSPTFLTPQIIFKLNKPMSYKFIMGKGSFYLSLSQLVHFLRQNYNTQRFAFKFFFHMFFYGFAPMMLGEDFQPSFPRTIVFNFNSLWCQISKLSKGISLFKKKNKGILWWKFFISEKNQNQQELAIQIKQN